MTPLNKIPFGLDLANEVVRKLKSPSPRVAERLKARGKPHGLFIQHKEYCGHGLWFDGTQFILCEVEDGSPGKTLLSWKNESDIVKFLAEQSDYTCSGTDMNSKVFCEPLSSLPNNQRLTRDRLEQFIAHY